MAPTEVGIAGTPHVFVGAPELAAMDATLAANEPLLDEDVLRAGLRAALAGKRVGLTPRAAELSDEFNDREAREPEFLLQSYERETANEAQHRPGYAHDADEDDEAEELEGEEDDGEEGEEGYEWAEKEEEDAEEEEEEESGEFEDDGQEFDDTEVEAEEREHATERARREEPEDFENGDDKLDTQAGEKEKRPGVLSWLMGGGKDTSGAEQERLREEAAIRAAEMELFQKAR